MENIFANAEIEQINIFDVLKDMGKIKPCKKNYSSELPEKVKAVTGFISFSNFISFITDITGMNEIVIYKRDKWARYSDKPSEYFIYAKDSPAGTKFFGARWGDYLEETKIQIGVYRDGSKTLKGILIYVTEGGAAYEAKITFHIKDNYLENCFYIQNIEISKWKKAKLHAHSIECILNSSEADEILKRVNPYAYAFKEEFSVDKLNEVYTTDLLIAPQLEQLHKAGYGIAKEVRCALQGYEDSSVIEQFGRLTQPGKNMKEIFKTSKAVYTALKDCNKLSAWDIYRKMDKQGKISSENIKRAYNDGYSEKELNEINSILGFEYDGKKIFTWNSLLRYLERIDMYEAIDRYDGLILLKDYLSMCRQLEMKPRIDGDSLKREHDVTARTLRQKRDEIRAGKMVGVCEDNKRYDYSEHIYFGRCIRSYDDLIDEATQQHNCVASYADSIIAKRCYIFVVREVSNPARSLATVEITPSGEIRQKFLAYNRPIRNKALTEFIERLAKNFKDIKKNAIDMNVA